MHDFSIHGQTLNLSMGKQEDAATGGLIHPAGLHPNKAIFNQIDPAHTMLASQAIEFSHHFQG